MDPNCYLYRVHNDFLTKLIIFPFACGFYLLQQEPIFEPSWAVSAPSLVPPVLLAPAASPSLGNFLAMARKMSFTLRAV